MFSREEVIKCPQMMTLLGYLHQEHGLPKYGWQTNSLRYHYTDAAGLLGIIQSGRLWATDIRFMNDPSEGAFLPERLLNIMGSKEEGVDAIEEKIIAGIRKSLHNRDANQSRFCVSFSANGDLLSQWRGYGSFGKGYAIGLKLDGGKYPHPQIAQYYDVIYGDEGLVALATDLLDIFVTAYEKWEDEFYDMWAYTLNVLAESFKDPSYSEEKESRLVSSCYGDDDDRFRKELPLHFKSKGGDIIPYIAMSLNLIDRDIADMPNIPRLPIEKIIVGPGVDFQRNAASLKALLKEYSYEDVSIVPSLIPFRS